MASSLKHAGSKFIEKYLHSKKLVDVYSEAWIERQYKDNPDFFFIDMDDFKSWQQETKGQIEGHLYLLKVEDDNIELKQDVVNLFPWMKDNFSAPIGTEAIHDPDIIFFNNAIQSVYLIKLGRHSRIMAEGPFDALGAPVISMEQFTALDLGGVVNYLESGLSDTGEAYEELAGADLNDEDVIEMLCEAIEDAQQPIRQFFEIWELDTDDY